MPIKPFTISVGNKLYLSVLSVFVLFAAAFIVFQQSREKQYKIDSLNIRLQDYNARMEDWLQERPMPSEEELDRYVEQAIPDYVLVSWRPLPERFDLYQLIATDAGYDDENRVNKLLYLYRRKSP